jgi:hypothetical protein
MKAGEKGQSPGSLITQVCDVPTGMRHAPARRSIRCASAP